VEFEPDSSEGGLVYLVETDDGSCIVGEPQLEALKARWAPVGELEVPLAKVQSIEFNARGRTAEVVSQSGDVLQVALSLARFDLDTSFGAVSIPLEHVARLTVGPAGGFDGRKGAARIFRTARNLLVNGDFESGPDIRMACFPLNPGSTAITGWTVTRGQIDYQDGIWQSSDRRVVDLDGSPGFGGIAQTFQTVPGQSYRVTFDMAGDLGGPPQIKRMRVEAAGQSAEFTFDIKRMPVQAAGQSAEFTFDSAGRSREKMRWVTRTWQFTATERQTTIEFFSLDAVGGRAGPVIDNTKGGWLWYVRTVGGLAGPLIDNVLLLPCDVKAGAVAAPQFGSVIGVDDGSCIVGNPTVETLTVASGSVGRIEVPITEIVSITRGEGRGPATVTLRSGDVLHGTLDAADLELQTSYGTLSIPIEHIVRFSGAARETPAASLARAPKMYWTDSGTGKIQRADLDGSNVEVLVDRLALDVKPGESYINDIALDVKGGKMYWSDSGTHTLGRANLDGSSVERLVVTGLDSPENLCVDVVRGQMYWVDRGTHKIQRANLDLSNEEDIVTTGLETPNGIDVDVVGGMIYWTDSATHKIQRANLDGTEVQDVIVSGLNYPRGIALDVARGKMYWTDLSPARLRRANLDGSQVEDLVTTGLGDPDIIALDLAAGKMYWTDLLTNKIQRANLDGSGVEDVITSGLDDPRGIALEAG
jgi:choice-of-anchor C domain-containing protein